MGLANRRAGIPLRQILFSPHSGGRSGVALLVLRAALGVVLVWQGAFCLLGPASVVFWRGVTALLGGSLLVIGFLTPLGALLGLAAGILSLFAIPACSPDLFDGTLSVVLAAAILFALALLGPGAFSVDARVFGRREIIFPPASSLRK